MENINELNYLETELKIIKRQKRNDLNNCYFYSCNYYDIQILELERKIKKIKDIENLQEDIEKDLYSIYLEIVFNENKLK